MIGFILKICLFATVSDLALLLIFTSIENYFDDVHSSLTWKITNKICDILGVILGVVAVVAMFTGVAALFQKLFL